ncbi:hypothetical protein AUJ46_04815 [Candidatus Peregrinibacteria bacterium CG1_02_54_53]|nr:MAG: hypothetical protein AUJ46_04815 [Candidatus Peregrinibacteria bacterium CG1_02_54_53]
MHPQTELLASAETALHLLSPRNEPQQRIKRASLRVRDNLFGIVADAYPFLSEHQRRLADWLYDMHLRDLADRGLRPITLDRIFDDPEIETGS